MCACPTFWTTNNHKRQAARQPLRPFVAKGGQMLLRRSFIVAVTGCLLSIISTGPARAQGLAMARVSGTVTDDSGGVVTHAVIQATNLGTASLRSTLTNSGGRFTIADLQIGSWDIRASSAGFESVVRPAVVLTVGADLVVDFTLKLGQARETVNVSAQVSRVETQTGAISSLVTSQQLDNLPLNGRNFEQLIAMAPGVSVVQSTLSQTAGITANPIYGNQNNYSISGSRPVGTAFLLDDTDISDFFNHGTGSGVAGTTLGVDAIAEFQLLTNTYSAQFGGSGGVVNMASRSGTNQTHGAVYEYLRNNNLDSRGYFDVNASGQPAPAPPYRRNQFGGRLGGPLRKNKLFFFVNYEGLRSSLGQTGIAYVPEPYVLKGEVCGVNPQTASPGAATCPTARLAQVVPSVPAVQAAILGLYPKPLASAPDLGGYSPFPESASLVTGENYFLGRLDYSISSRDSVFGRYVTDRVNQTNPFAGSMIPLWSDLEITRNQYITAEERHVIGAAAVNMARVSFVRTHSGGNPTSEEPALDLFPTPGRPNTVVSPGGGLSALGANASEPFRIIQNKTSVGDDFLWSRGAHRLMAGASAARVQSIFAQGAYEGGDFTFFTLSNFLLGSADLYFGAASPTPAYNSSRGFRQIDFFPYIQDDWKLLPKVTLNLGLRWDFTTNPVGSGAPLEAVVNPLTDSSYTIVRHAFARNPNWGNIDPRFGLAYDPFADHKTSIRAGFGIFHEQVEARTYAPGYISAAPSGFVLDEPPAGGIPFPSIPNVPFDHTQGISYKGTNHAPYEIQYNITLQREILAGTVVSLAYVGSHGVHLFNQVNENLPIPCSSASTPLPPWCPATPSGAPGSATNPFTGQLRNPSFAALGDAAPISTSRYQSFQASVKRQFGPPFQMQASYSWSRCIDDGSATYPLEDSFGASNPFDRRLDRGPCAFNRSQNLAVNAIYSLPFRESRFVSGWQLAGLVTGATGLPVNVADGYDQSLGGGEGRPNYSGAGGCHPHEIVNRPIAGPAIQYYNPACYSLEPIGTDGNVGRNSIYGPGLFNVDFSIIKRTAISEKLNSEFRAEIFNLLNRANFGLPNPAVFTGPTGGQITTLATPPRQIQFALRLLF
jgi:hypothetical protein